MTLGLKFLLCLNINFFGFKKALFRYYGFSVAINVFLLGCGQRCLYIPQEWVQAEITVTI